MPNILIKHNKWHHWGTCLALLTSAFSAWIAFFIYYPSLMGGTDVYHFKDPGCNMALGHGFVSSSYVGSESFERLPWLSQGPVFPYLYGIFASLFGCNATSNNLFDFLIASILALQTIFLTTRLQLKGSNIFLILSLAVFLPTGGYQWTQDRPDHLALAFLLGSLISVSMPHPQSRAHKLSFFLSGMALVTSPYYGLVGMALSTFYLLNDRDYTVNSSVRPLIAGAIFYIIPIASIIVIYANADPSSFTRFFKHATIIAGDENGYLAKLKHGISSAGLASMLEFFRFAVVCVLLAYAFSQSMRSKEGTREAILTGTLLTLAAGTILAFPKQGNYFSAIAYLATVVWIHFSKADESPQSQRKHIHGILVANMLLPLTPGIITSVINPIRMQASFADQLAHAKSEASIYKKLAPNRVALVPASHYFMYKEKLDYIFNPDYISSSHNQNEIAASIICRAGKSSDTLGNTAPGWYLFDITSLPPVNGGIPGIFSMRSYWDWGCATHIKSLGDKLLQIPRK
jgi:Dolichyl-phosphate-mannose-protein mannosyltransferase